MPKRSLSLERSRQLQAQPAGSKSWISFTGSEERALVNGDIAALEPELNETLKRLLDGGIHIASIHTHLIQETPRILFFHFWGTGPAAELAETFRLALEFTDEHQSNGEPDPY